MISNVEPIGVFGGSFDPIHFGHLNCAMQIFEKLKLSEIRFIPSGNPVHRNKHFASSLQPIFGKNF